MPHLYCRWLISRDVPAVLALDAQAFGSLAITPVQLEHLRQETRMVGIVACIPVFGEDAEVVAGYAFYELGCTNIHVHRIAVMPSAQRLGIGTALLCKILLRRHGKRREATVFLNSHDAAARCFFRSNGWGVKREYEPFEAGDGGGMVELAFGYDIGCEVIERLWKGDARTLKCKSMI
jgi:ribosomal protein S18 acetylase RimI-like enzyme